MGSSHSVESEKHERDVWRTHLEHQYDGKHHRNAGTRFRRPYLDSNAIEERMNELQHGKQREKKRRYLNILGENDHEKYPDLDTYYSTTKEIPRRLIVQATHDAQKDTRARHWGHSTIKGNRPFVVWLSELCLNPFRFDRYDGGFVDEDDEKAEDIRWKKMSLARRIFQTTVHWIASTILTLLFAWIIQVVLSVQVATAPWSDSGAADSYDGYENVHWEWPHHAVNILDQSPNNKKPQSTITKLMIPRRLVVKDKSTGKWVVKMTDELRDKHTGMLQPYVFLSFSRANFLGVDDTKLRPFFHRVAEEVLERENDRRDEKDPVMEAFWLDMDCVASDPLIKDKNGNMVNPIMHADSEKTKDINSICDAVRCAKRVYVVLPDDRPEDKLIWGRRIWTLPEVLLAADKIRYCIFPLEAMQRDDKPIINNVLLTDMYNSFWAGHPSRSHLASDEALDTHEDAITHLVNHYTNRTKLSELQLFTFAIQALAQLTSGKDTRGESTVELAYAAMGLLAYRLTPDDNEDVFQAVARLSLVNDSNHLLERLLCLWPSYGENEQNPEAKAKYAVASSDTLLRNIADRDQYAVHLWDIDPMCDVVGIGNDKFTPTVITDRCRGIPIRWKGFPRMRYAQDLTSFRATLAQTVVFAGVWFFVTGFGLFSSAISLAMANNTGNKETNISVGSYLWGVAIFVGVGWMISWFSPLAVRQLCNGGSSGVSCHLIGFEGTMTLRQIEKAIYGNYNARLTYSPSSSIFSKDLRHPKLRMGVESPDENGDPEGPEHWKQQRVKHNIPDSHRLFTIVDTGDLTVTVIAAQRPPVVALIAGREGGMLRSLLCSWRFETNCLYRECVIRMRSSLEEQATPNDWLKISLASQSDVNQTRSLYQPKSQPLPPPPVAGSIPPSTLPVPPRKTPVVGQTNIESVQ